MRTRGEEEEAEIGNKYLCFPPLSLPFRHPCADRIAIPSSPFGSFGSPLQSHASKSTEKKTPPLQKKHPTTVRADDSPLDARRRRRHRLCPRRGARASVPCPGVPRLRGRVQGRPVRHGHGEQIDEGRERKRERKRRADLSLLSLLSSWLSVPFSSTSTSSPLSQKKKKKNSPHQLHQKAAVIATVRTAVTHDRDDPAREAAVAAVRQATNTWVAKYRRDNQFSGKPSYG